MPPPPIVSDTSPLLYLGRIGQEDLLPKLFSRVYVPEQVVGELDAGRLLRRDTPDPRQFPWVAIVPVSAVQLEVLPLNTLGPGEQAASLTPYTTPIPLSLLMIAKPDYWPHN